MNNILIWLLIPFAVLAIALLAYTLFNPDKSKSFVAWLKEIFIDILVYLVLALILAVFGFSSSGFNQLFLQLLIVGGIFLFVYLKNKRKP